MELTGFVREFQEIPGADGFRFHCDRCGHSHEASPPSSFKRKLLGAAGRALGTAGREAVNLSRDVAQSSGSRQKALDAAVEQVRSSFQECPGCGQWVCAAFCWNRGAKRCEDCAPNLDEVRAVRKMKDLQQEETREREAEDRQYDRSSVEKHLETKAILQGRACPKCGAAHRRGRFCNSCGADLDAPAPGCPACGAKNEPEARFCSGCGASVQA